MTVTKQMTISRADFVRLLNRLAGDGLRWEAACRWVVYGVRVTVEQMDDLRIGGLVLPRLMVHLDVSGLDARAAAEFLELFDRTFRRGGG